MHTSALGYVHPCSSATTADIVLAESVIIIPSFGLQFETHTGLPGVPLFASRRFIPFTYLQDFIINEGLRGWNVRYYLAAIEKSQDGAISLHVPYEVRY